MSLEAIQDKFGRSTKNAVEEGLDKSTDRATGQATGRAVTAAISEAWAASSASVCTEGGIAKDAQDSFAERVREAIAFLYAEVALQLCSQTSAGKSTYRVNSTKSPQIAHQSSTDSIAHHCVFKYDM